MDLTAATVGMLDLSGFTAFTRAEGDRAALNAALHLYESANMHLSEGVRVVKRLGDGLLLSAEREGVLEESIARLQRCWDGQLPLRACALRGKVIHHEEDVFGDLVNTVAHEVARMGSSFSIAR
jgi:class 3 adenylate cyclase